MTKSTSEPNVPPSPTPAVDIEQVLANMELRALKARPEERGRIYNLAGDMCFDAGLRERTLSFYGRAIDVFLAAEQFDSALTVCRKIVRLTPEVVRARCTLAWMALGRGLIQEAKKRISDYADAAASGGQEDKARQHLRLMSEVSENQEVLETLAEALLQLGDDAGADAAFGAAAGRRTGNSLPTDPEQRWLTILLLIEGQESSAAAAAVKAARAAVAAGVAETEAAAPVTAAASAEAPIDPAAAAEAADDGEEEEAADDGEDDLDGSARSRRRRRLRSRSR